MLKLPKTLKSDAIQRIAEIAERDTGSVFFSDHCEMRMQERDIRRRQVMQVLRQGLLIGEVEWNTEHESGWKVRLKRIASGEEITVVAKLIEREADCVVAVTTFKNS